MASSRNKGSSSGLRILWIPGRKRHNRKGRYESTNKNFDSYSTRYGGGGGSSVHKQGKNEIWSFGGSKGQEELIKTDISVDGGSSSNTTAVAQILPATCAVGLSLQSENDETKMRLENEPNKLKILSTYDDDMKKNSTSADVTIQQQQQQINDREIRTVANDIDDNTKISYINGNKIQMKSISQNNINSIQQDVENGDLLLKNSLSSSSSINDKSVVTDVPDSIFQNYTTADNIKRNRNNKKKKKRNQKNHRNHENDDNISRGSNTMNGDGDTTIADEDQRQQKKDKDEDEATVKCLYYTLMCCECSIS